MAAPAEPIENLLAPLATPEGALFVVLALGIVGMSIFCMTRKNPVTAVMSLVATFFGLAALYATLAAHFLAVLQVLVYAGAIMVLFIFVVMILNREENTRVSLRGLLTRLVGVAAGLYLLVTFVRVVIPESAEGLLTPGAVADSFGTVGSVGDVLFRQFMFPFEAMPRPAQWLAQALPLTHFMRIVRGISLKGSTFPDVQQELVWLAAILGLLLTIASTRVSKKLA